MIEIELDGCKVEVPEGSMVMHAADKAGTYIPHFCYHKKLTIAANCRMCLVDIEKSPKPMPACATPVAQGMIVRTHSDKAINAQKSVMEFLLINHPLDCPICDQGGECQLQDLAVGYGGSSSRYEEEKRVVFPKDVGPLISMAEMTRCIHCTRCVRFGQEVAGVMELGMIHRGEHSEITPIAGDTIDSELSGNMIDLCPVGALLSKPFRYSARTWELSRRKSISPHDSTGSNLIVQVKGHAVMRVLPLENEAVNECWIADRDRFSYEALSSGDRLTTPMLKQGGEWRAVDWTTALGYVAQRLTQVAAEHGAESIGALASPASTVEELFLLGRLVRGLGSDNIDYRTRHADFATSGRVQWLGTSIASLSGLQSALIVGSFLRKDHPLFALRLRQAAKKGGNFHSIHALDDDSLVAMAGRIVRPPSEWLAVLAEVEVAVGLRRKSEKKDEASGLSDAALAIADSLLGGERKAILLGNAAAQHPQASRLFTIARSIAEQTGASVGWLTDGANAVGAQLVDALPIKGGRNAARMLDGSLKAALLLNLEPALDFAAGGAAVAALRKSELVVAMTSFADAATDCADVLLPIAPFTETSGTFVSAEGRAQSFHGVVKPLGETRPAWKVLRVLGNLLGLPEFIFETSEQVRDIAIGDAAQTESRLRAQPAPADAPIVDVPAAKAAGAVERIADVPIYATDALVRRAHALQHTVDANCEFASVGQGLWARLDLDTESRVRLMQAGAGATLRVRLDPSLAEGVVRAPAGMQATAALSSMFGPMDISKV